MNKKGVFFTVIAIALLSLFLVSFSIYSFVRTREAVNKRIETMNNYVFSLEQDLPRKMYISGFRIIFLFEKRISSEIEYIDDIEARFNETFFDGTVYGETSPEIEQLMEKSTYSGIEESLNEKAAKVNLEVELSNSEVSISQDDPWRIKVTLKTDLLVRDKGDLALWNKTTTSVAHIPISSFEDPIHFIESNILRRVNQTPYDDPIALGNLTNHVDGLYYVQHNDAPNFLNRMEGDLSASGDTGIESIVHLPKLTEQGIPILDKSVVDHIYFSGSNPRPINPPVGYTDYSWVRIDQGHTGKYGV